MNRFFIWEDFSLKSLNRSRTVRIYLPPGFEPGKGSRYPVFLFQDGQNLFDHRLSLSGKSWRLAETLDRLWASRAIPPFLAVGVDNGGRSRMDEYSPWRIRRPFPVNWLDLEYGGEGAAFVESLVHGLKPALEAELGATSGPWAIGGSSMGAIISLYAALLYPEVFSQVLAFSPAVWAVPGGWEDFLRTAVLQGQRVFLSVGTNETSDASVRDFAAKYVEGARWTREVLSNSLGRGPLRYEEVSGAIHDEDAWASLLPEALEWLFLTDRRG